MKIVNAWLCTVSNLVDTFDHDKKYHARNNHSGDFFFLYRIYVKLYTLMYYIPHSKKTCFPTKKLSQNPLTSFCFGDLFQEQKDLYFIPKGKRKLSIRRGNLNSFVKTRLRSGIVVSSSF